MHIITPEIHWTIVQLVKTKIKELGLDVSDTQELEMINQLRQMYMDTGTIQDFQIKKTYVHGDIKSGKSVGYVTE